ncbi:MAG: hypothetical protein ABI992_07420 [Chthoniobacterales bacterium]
MAAESEPELKLEIAHVLTIDVVAYSTLLIHEQSRVMTELNRVVRNTPCFRRAETDGKLTRLPTGDGMALVFFTDSEAPMECSMQISAELKSHPEIQLRMGIHSGPINQIRDVNDRSNVAGAGIDMAQRVMDCGDAGHILVSKRVADDLAPYKRWNRHLHDLGECEIKHGRRVNIFNFYTDSLGNPATPEKLVANVAGAGRKKRPSNQSRLVALWTTMVGVVVAVLFTGLWMWFHAKASGPKQFIPEKSIAVLPFENRSEDPANSYFADGIQDEILTRLAKIADLKVISRTSMQHYKTAPGNLSEIGRELGVAYILEGSVQKSGEMVRINVQLIKAATDSHAWADTFDRKLTDIFLVESEVARAIADRLRVQVTGDEEQIIAANPTDNLEAYDAYLRGLAYTFKTGNSSADAISAQKYLRDAVRLDPNFALAWALLSYIDSTGYLTIGLQPTAALREEARQAAETALTLQPDLGEARLAVGQYNYACLKDYDTAVRYFEQARRLLPNSSRIPQVLAYVARRRGQWDRSETYFNEAERLDPRNLKVMTEHAFLYESRRQFPQALQKSDQILKIAPDDLNTLALQAAIAQAEGDLTSASSLLDRLRPGAVDAGVIFVKAYQSILERRPMKMVPWLREMLTTRDPAGTNLNGELDFWLGWAEQMAGDDSAAEQTWRHGREELKALLQNQPENDILIGNLALINMALGNKTEALSLAKRAMTVNPIQKDAISGPGGLEVLARVAAQTGERDQAITALRKLLSIPYSGPVDVPLTPALLRLDPLFDPIRNDPEFQKLASATK